MQSSSATFGCRASWHAGRRCPWLRLGAIRPLQRARQPSIPSLKDGPLVVELPPRLIGFMSDYMAVPIPADGGMFAGDVGLNGL
jgi:hypothetical protein